MPLRLAFAFFFFSFFFSVNAQELAESEHEKAVCGGVERWTIKVLTDAQAAAVNYTPVVTTIADLIAIPTPDPPNPNASRIAGIEYQTYSVTCKITIKKNEDDNDFHLVLKDGNKTLIGEVPDPACYAAGLSVHNSEYVSARNWVNAHIASGNVYNVNLPEVVVTGVAFVDPPHGQTGAAPNNIELHPILDIHFAPAAGISEETAKILDVSISPNPFSTSATIKVHSKINDLKSCTLKLFNLLGEEVKETTLPVSNQNQISYVLDKNELGQGVFFYRITNSGYTLHEGKLVAE